MNTQLDKYTLGFGISAAIVILFNAFLMILKEEIPLVHKMMVALSGHHWTSHGLIDVTLFILLGFLFSNRSIKVNISSVIIASTVVGVLLIIGMVVI